MSRWRDSRVIRVMREAEGEQRVDVEQVGHGKSASMARTIALVSGGVPTGTMNAGKPDSLLRPILALVGFLLSGFKKIPPSRTAHAKRAPG